MLSYVSCLFIFSSRNGDREGGEGEEGGKRGREEGRAGNKEMDANKKNRGVVNSKG